MKKQKIKNQNYIFLSMYLSIMNRYTIDAYYMDLKRVTK